MYAITAAVARNPAPATAGTILFTSFEDSEILAFGPSPATPVTVDVVEVFVLDPVGGFVFVVVDTVLVEVLSGLLTVTEVLGSTVRPTET